MTARTLKRHVRHLHEELHTLEQRMAEHATPPGTHLRTLVLALGFIAGYVFASPHRKRPGTHR